MNELLLIIAKMLCSGCGVCLIVQGNCRWICTANMNKDGDLACKMVMAGVAMLMLANQLGG